MAIVFRSRKEAGEQLAARLKGYRGKKNLIVLAFPRGGVTVGWEIARKLGCPLDVLIVRKIGCPGNSELGCRGQVQGFCHETNVASQDP
jgi:putative phosphoribosyl transferase